MFKLVFPRAVIVALRLAAIAIVIVCVTCSPGGSPSGARNVVPRTGSIPDRRRQLRALECPESRPSIEIGCGCAVDGDCAVALHFVDCCGSAVAIGIARSELAVFETKEKACNPAAGLCECVASPTRTSDGLESADPHEIGARCAGGVCVTFSRATKASSPPPPVASSMPATEPTPTSVEKVPCKTEKDCWVSSEPVLHPIRRPKGAHHRFVPCVDGEVPPICDEGSCALGSRYRC